MVSGIVLFVFCSFSFKAFLLMDFEGLFFVSLLLKENQVMALKEKGIAAEYLSSTQATHVRNKVIDYSVFLGLCV